MKTLNLVNVIQATTLENTATVYFTKDGLLCNVDVTEIPSVGTVMSKYFGTEIQVRPVARNELGRFVSIKGLEEQLIKAGLNSGFITVTKSDPVQDMIALLASVPKTESVSNVVEMSFGTKDKPAPITRVLGGTHLKIPEPIVKVVVAPTSFVDKDSVPADFDPLYDVDTTELSGYVDPFEDCNREQFEQGNYDNLVEMDINHNKYVEHNPNNMVEETDVSDQAVVKKACRVVYNHVNNMYLKTINSEQLKQHFGYIWNNNVDLHLHKDLMKYYIFDCIKYYFTTALGNRRFMTMAEFKQVLKTALCQAVQLSLAA